MAWLRAWRMPLHRSWLTCMGLIGVVVGLALAPVVAFLASWLWLMAGVLLYIFTLLRPRRGWLVLALVAGFLMGGARGATQIEQRSIWQSAIGQTVTIRGVVAEDVDRDERGNRTIKLRDVSYKSQELPGRVWLSLAEPAKLKRSDIVTVRVELSDGFGSFAATGFRADVISSQRPVPGDVALTLRDNFAEQVRQFIDEPMASLGLGFLTGQRRSLPPDFEEALRVAGLTHIVVASGYNLTILVRLIKRLFEKRSRFQTVFLSLALVAGFIAITGLSPSMMRAGLVTSLALVAWYFGRRFHPIMLLALAAAVTGFITPSYVWGNLGWQLSFAAFFGVMILAPLLQGYFFGKNRPGILRQIMGETISAQLLTAPLILLSFGTISLVALPANLLVLPLVPLAMLLTFTTGIFGYILPLLAGGIGLVSQGLLDYMVSVTTTVSNFSWAQATLEITLFSVILTYLAIAVLCWYLNRTGTIDLRDQNIIE